MFGAALFLVGAFTRIVAFVLSGEMAFAYFMAHAPRSFYPIVNAGEVAILFCFIFLYFAFAGGGPLSVDRAALDQVSRSAGCLKCLPRICQAWGANRADVESLVPPTPLPNGGQ